MDTPVSFRSAQVWFVLSAPSAVLVRAASLPAAERAVAEAVLEGLSSADTARRRGTSLKTVANQLTRLFERLDVHSRMALVRELERSLACRSA